MSLFEILVVLIVALLLVKPEDLPQIAAKFKELKNFVQNTKTEFMSYLDPVIEEASSVKEDLASDFTQMNFYLEKIAELDSEYEGEYSLPEVKEHYRKLMNSKIKTELEGR